jgi:hypothetical protein
MRRSSAPEIAMRIAYAFDWLAEHVVPAQLDRFFAHIEPKWVQEALMATGTATLRRRRLPAEQVVWLVIGMALMRNDSIERVVAMLDLALPTSDGQSPAKSSLTQARSRLGEDPLAYLFVLTAAAWAAQSAERHAWRGLRLYGVDGSTLRIPDSPENRAAFHGQPEGGRAGGAYPALRMVALMALRSHLLSALIVADYLTGETTMWKQLWHEVPDDSLIVVDRGFLVANDLTQLARAGSNRHWLTRAKSNTQLKTIKRLSRNDSLVEICLSAQTRRAYPELPERWIVRAIRYQRRGFKPSLLLTSLIDAERYPAGELVDIYHERWEIEGAYDEIKTHMLAREETIRSRTPVGVRQEVWGIALAFNLIRLEMERAANELGVAPTRISFVNALALIKYAWVASSMPPLAPGTIPKRLLDVRRQMKLLLVPERPGRSYPRAVKIKMSNYPRKRAATTNSAK